MTVHIEKPILKIIEINKRFALSIHFETNL